MWKRILSELITSSRYQDKSQPGGCSNISSRLTARPTRDDVFHAFRFLLGREPENDTVVDAHLRARSVAALRVSLINSEEFKGQYKALHPDSNMNPYWSADKEALIFIHLKKTGGNSLRRVLQGYFSPDRICPMRDNSLHMYSVAELASYDLFAGHFDLRCRSFIPRHSLKTVCMFREPASRLISFYRFARAHPPHDEFLDNQTIRLANELSAEEFYERPEMRCTTETYNHYLMALGLTCSWFDHTSAPPPRDTLIRACENATVSVRALTAIGITERFADSVEYICHACNLPNDQPIRLSHVTDNLSKVDTRFRNVEQVVLSPRLSEALEDLIVFDREIYRFAVAEFERRFAEHKSQKMSPDHAN